MCGITGFIDFKHHSSQEILLEMLKTISHRGPDGNDLFFISQDNLQIGLGHNRLSIIDLSSAANQPFHFEKYTLIFNGEIYNYQEIKKELTSLGHDFKTNSDTEVVIHAYQEWGIKCVEHFIGMFAIVIFDKIKNKIVLIRDRAGVKPLFYYFKNGLFLFASELKAFHKHPKFEKEIDFNALNLYLKYCYVPAPHSIFQHTFKLLPGHYLELSLENSELKEIKYWDVIDAYNQPTLKISDSEAIQETEKVLKKAFDYRMVADVPVGVFLSGGYDSSAVAALLQKNSTQKIKTFTIGFHEEKYNEAPYAKQVADYLGTEHTEYYCTPAEAKAILPTLPFFYDEPFGDSSAIPTILVSQLARKSVSVSLSADGGDEIFGGYNRYPIIEKVNKTVGKLPSFSRNALHKLSGIVQPEKIPYFKNKPLIGERYSKFRKLIKESDANSYLQNMCSIFDDEALSNLLKNKTEKLVTFFDEKNPDIPGILNQVLAIDFKTYMADDILAKVDRATMSVGLEGREPFLDQHIIDWVAKLPSDMKIRKGCKKWILKEIVHSYLPKEMMDRPKWGFAIPIDEWFKQELSEYFNLYFNRNFIEKQNIFNFEELNLILTNYKLGKKEFMVHLWTILMFQLWYEKWMN